jgi:ribosomal protein S18 acetylase RimI-like enzyme
MSETSKADSNIPDFQINCETKEGEPYVLRYPRMSDCDGMVDVINSLVDEKAPVAVEEHIDREKEPEFMENLLQDIEKNNGICIVAEKDGKVLGWAGISKAHSENPEEATLFVMFLNKEGRGKEKGISDNLLETAMSEAQRVLEIKKINLWTFEKNNRAVGFYKKHGFLETGIKGYPKEHYGETWERIEMAKDL